MSDPKTADSNRSLDLTQVLEEEYDWTHSDLPYAPDKKGCPEERLKQLFDRIHKHEPDQRRVALCLSGGGIRSGTFALGVLQGLARHGLLKRLTYLSTVSGGGYAGGWLSAWIHRHDRGIDGVTEELQHPRLKPEGESKLDVEPETIRHLRNYSNYLSPRLGMLSADTWTLVALVVRNLILNWLVLVPLLLAVLAAPRLLMSIVRWPASGESRPFALWATLLLALGAGLVSVVYVGLKRPSANLTEKDNQNHFLYWCLLPLLVSGTSLVIYWAWLRNPANSGALRDQLTPDYIWPAHYVMPFILFGVLLYVIGWIIYARVLGQYNLWQFLSIVVTGALGGILLWVVATRVYPYPRGENVFVEGANGAVAVVGAMTYVSFAVPIYLGLFFLAITLFAGISSKWTEDEDREWWARFGAWLLIAVVAWAVVSALVLMGPSVAIATWTKYAVAGGGVFGLVATLLGRSALSPGTQEKEKKTGVLAVLMRYIVPVGAIIFAAVLVILLSLLTNYLFLLVSNLLGERFPSLALPPEAFNNGSLDATRVILHAPIALVLVTGIALAGLGLMMAYLVSTNKFSHHAMYRNRIIRAYLGASRGGDDTHGHRDIREPNLFTGFDPDDNLPMHELRPELFHPASFTNIKRLIDGLKDAKKMEAPKDKEGPEYKKYMANNLALYLKEQLLSLPPDATAQTNLGEQLDKYYPLDKEGKPVLDEKGNPVEPPKLLRRAFINAANALLRRGESLYDPKIFAGVELSAETKQLLDEIKRLQDTSARGEASATHSRRRLEDRRILLNRLLLKDAYPDEIEKCPEPPQKPFHVVNMTLNLVRGQNLAWQERKAESFTVSPLHCGSFQIPDPEEETPSEKRRKRRGSYRESREYGGRNLGGISVGTAIAVSGAAVSPNMGYYSSPVVTFLMTLLNVRLGWWLGNPSKKYYDLAHPKSAVYPIVAEALGLTDDENDYIYLSDGGHFENLGLYEMVLRRCKVIIVCDATGDPKFEFNDLGNAIRKCRVDLGIPIEFEHMPIYPRTRAEMGKYCAIGRIDYGCVDEGVEPGVLIYLKPAFYGNVGGSEPRDVYHYALSHEDFPHESTGDQFFGEAQFESYRILGSHTIEQILGQTVYVAPDDLKPDRQLNNLIVRAYEHCGKNLAWLEEWMTDRDIKFKRQR
ncbi:MAG TPA: patatin-like phospholipase family protein [Pyrinomonadaceae bacterium]|nr:patatin-like phospholipase family protein [Pyrinomonadaceae bacterium]